MQKNSVSIKPKPLPESTLVSRPVWTSTELT